MYTHHDFKTKKSLKEAVTAGKKVILMHPTTGELLDTFNGIEYVEGPHYPAPHTWYAQVTVENGIILKVK